MHNVIQNYDVSLAKEFQEHLTKKIAKMVSLISSNTKKYSWKENGQTDSIVFKITLMLHTKVLKFIVAQINSQHYLFVFHIPNLMAQGG